MGRNKASYKGFTLVEMLIVMGILILLMALGIGGGRLALQNAADVATQSAVKQIYEAAQAYMTKNGKFPIATTGGTKTVKTIATVDLKDYMESFDGGNDTTFYYVTNSSGDYILVCAILGGKQDATDSRGGVCDGNAFSNTTAVGVSVTGKKFDQNSTDFTEMKKIANPSNWEGKAWK